METYFLDLIPRLQRFSQKLDNLTKLSNQHWVVVDEISNAKNVYIFRANGELLISHNGKVEKAKWEYLGNNSLLIDRKEESYLFKHGFLDENILALKVDSKEEYAFLVNENKFYGELNSIDKIAAFLTKTYLESPDRMNLVINGTEIDNKLQIESKKIVRWLDTNKGKLEIRTNLSAGYTYGDLVFLEGEPAPDGKYILGWPAWLNYIVVTDGKLSVI